MNRITRVTYTYHIDMKRVVNRKLNIGIADRKAFADGREIYFEGFARMSGR